MRISVTLHPGDPIETTLADYIIANGIGADDAEEISAILNNGLEYIGGGGAAPFYTIVKINPDLAPFSPGARVLAKERPWSGSWMVERCARVASGWRVYLRAGAAEGHDNATHYRLAAADWQEPPVQPLLAINDAEYREGRTASQADMLAYYRRYVAWGKKHLAPLGHQKHVAGFERLIAMVEAERAPAQEAAQ
jgi:hypothetical protein